MVFHYLGPDKKTKYKMVARDGETGKKFICPVGDIISSCRYM